MDGLGSSQVIKLVLWIKMAAIIRGKEAMANSVRPFMKPRRKTWLSKLYQLFSMRDWQFYDRWSGRMGEGRWQCEGKGRCSAYRACRIWRGPRVPKVGFCPSWTVHQSNTAWGERDVHGSCGLNLASLQGPSVHIKQGVGGPSPARVVIPSKSSFHNDTNL